MTTIQQGTKILQDAIANGSLVPASARAFPPTPNPQPNPVYPNAPNPNLRSPLPTSQVMNPDTQRQWFQQAVPQARISPQPASSSPTANASAQSQAISSTINNTTNVPGGSLYSVQIQNPPGSFGGDGNLTYNPVDDIFTIGARVVIDSGAPLVSGSFAISGWGSGAAVSAVSGTDQAHSFTVTAGTAPSVDPTISLTFTGGAWANAPVIFGQMVGGTGSIAFLQFAVSTTGYVATFYGLPVATATYIFSIFEVGV